MQGQATFLRRFEVQGAEKGDRIIWDEEGILSKMEEILKSLSLILDSPQSRFWVKDLNARSLCGSFQRVPVSVWGRGVWISGFLLWAAEEGAWSFKGSLRQHTPELPQLRSREAGRFTQLALPLTGHKSSWRWQFPASPCYPGCRPSLPLQPEEALGA